MVIVTINRRTDKYIFSNGRGSKKWLSGESNIDRITRAGHNEPH
jgi:hypothetical protein